MKAASFPNVDKNPIANLEVIGPFDLVALYDKEGRFGDCACSCGWKWSGFPDELLDAATFHNATHTNVLKIQKLYETHEVSYDCALNFLLIVSELNEGRANELMVTWSLK